MIVQLRKTIAVFIQRWYPERQFFYRSRGQVRFVSLSQHVQIASSLLLVAGLGGGVFAWVTAPSYAELAAGVAGLREERNALQAQAKSLTTQVAALQDKLGDALKQVASIPAKDTRIAELTSQQTSSQTRLLALNSQVSTLQTNLDDALKRVAEIKRSQETLVAHIQERTESNAERLEQAIAMTRLDLNKLMADSSRNSDSKLGRGGPFIPPSAAAPKSPFADMQDLFESSVVQLEAQLDRWASLESIFERLPVVPPVNTGHVSSRFGKRSDPFTEQQAFHSGIDFSAELNTPVYATAPGLVTFAGRDGPYGYVVEIDHGLGIKTRHGHLNKVLVKQGERVVLRQKIGLIGSTGRSTGPHVHFEVLYRGTPRDPANFMEAGRYVFKE
jgi:murein DD-endopeptidase MepM/ murein hydrolase activator NlpD